MDRVRLMAAALAAMAGAGCTMNRDVDIGARIDTPVRAVAEIRQANGVLAARSTTTQEASGIRIRIDAAGLPRGVYAVHVHDVGLCDPPGFESAGPHWNPTGSEHGAQNPQGHHKGDLPNLMIDASGTGSIEYVIPGAGLTRGDPVLLDANGAALVIHANPDDYRTNPSGNSGARIACGVFTASR